MVSHISREARRLYAILHCAHLCNCAIIVHSTCFPDTGLLFRIFDIIGNFSAITTLPLLYLCVWNIVGRKLGSSNYIKHLSLPLSYAIIHLIYFILIWARVLQMPAWWYTFSVPIYNLILISQALFYSYNILILNLKYTIRHKSYYSTTEANSYGTLKTIMRCTIPFFAFTFFMMLIRLSTFHNRIWLALFVIVPMCFTISRIGIMMLRLGHLEDISLTPEKHLPDEILKRLRAWMESQQMSNSIYELKDLDLIVKEWQEAPQKHYLTSGITINTVSEQLNIPSRILSTYLNNSLKINFNTWINNLRIDEVKRLLTTEESTLEKIALQCGFTDRSQLIRIFKRVEGCTPKVYKTKMKEEKGGEQ